MHGEDTIGKGEPAPRVDAGDLVPLLTSPQHIEAGGNIVMRELAGTLSDSSHLMVSGMDTGRERLILPWGGGLLATRNLTILQ